MNHMIRSRVILLLAGLPMLAAGCATNRCEDVLPHQLVQEASPLTIPAGVTGLPDSGEYRIPAGERYAVKGCLVEPPQTLPKEALDKVEQANSEQG
ncbi:MAG: hypothetical protein R3217_00535 [Gammaproteobacteria bacterium]|nr:hypothetical protein [Gammaproteobacteria bacterium]